MKNLEEQLEKDRIKIKELREKFRKINLRNLKIIAQNILFDLVFFFSVENKETVLLVCIFVNSWSAKWICAQYTSLNYYYNRRLCYIETLLHIFAILSSLLLAALIYPPCQEFIFSHLAISAISTAAIIFVLGFFMKNKIK